VLRVKNKNGAENLGEPAPNKTESSRENSHSGLIPENLEDPSEMLLTQVELDQILLTSPTWIQKLIKNHYLNNSKSPETLNELKNFLSEQTQEFRSLEAASPRRPGLLESQELKNLSASLWYTQTNRLQTEPNPQFQTFASNENLPQTSHSQPNRKPIWLSIKHPIIPFSQPQWTVKRIFGFYDMLKSDFSILDDSLNLKKRILNTETQQIMVPMESKTVFGEMIKKILKRSLSKSTVNRAS
jgi:hypothetical protein